MKLGRHALIVFAVLLALHGLLGTFPKIMTAFGVGPSLVWFRDMHSMLAASDSAAAGFDPSLKNPYDLGAEKHIYTDWWYALSRFGLTRGDAFWLGGLVIALFWLAVSFVLRVRSSRDAAWTLLLCASPPVWLAVNRANPDLLIFALLTPVVFLLAHRERWLRLLAPVPVALATGLKFFPALAGVVFLYPAASRREGWQRWTLIAVLTAFLVWSLEDDVQRYLAASWVGRGLFTFGAAAIPIHFGVNIDAALSLGRLLGVSLIAWFVWRQPADAATAENPPSRDRMFFLMGAAVLGGSFFLTVGYLYKIIFAVWLLPVLLARSTQTDAAARAARLSLACLVGLVWVEGLVCAVISLWPGTVGPEDRVLLHRAAATIAGLLAWGFILPVMKMFGAELRSILPRFGSTRT